ncbi:hypothetical protein ACMYSQ_012508 [Aspergillus niger]
MSADVGSVALNGKEEYIRGFIFDAVEYDRYIIGRGTLIMIIPPTEGGEAKTYRDVETELTIHVPPKHEVKVVDALVRMTT